MKLFRINAREKGNGMKGRTLTVILTAVALSLSTAAGARAQHEGHQMPAKPVKKKATPTKKKTTARISARKCKTPSRSSQAGKAAPQSTTTKDTQQNTTMDHSAMGHATMDHSKMDMRQRGSAGISRMSDESRHALVMAYAQSIGTFAKTLRDRVESTQTVDAGFALGIVDEMKRSLDAIEQQLREHSVGISVSTKSQMSTMLHEMQNRVSALRQNLTSLERDLQTETPGTSSVLQRDEIIRLSGATPGTPHQHGTGTKPDDQRSITKQEDDMRESAVVYTCSMHPEVTSDKPGKCPKCGMTLVKKKGS